MAVAGADTLQFEATAEVRAKIFKQTVIELHGGEFWATWCRPKKATVTLQCSCFASAADLQCCCADFEAVQEEDPKQLADSPDDDGQSRQQALLQRAGRNDGAALPPPAWRLTAVAWLLHHDRRLAVVKPDGSQSQRRVHRHAIRGKVAEMDDRLWP